MKKILFLLPLLITALFGFSQSKGYLRYDSLYIERIGGNGELILLNQSRNQKGFLYNQGNGRTIFKAGVETLNDSTFVIGNDTLHINPSTFGSPVTASQSVLKTGDNFTLFGDSTTLTGFKVYGYDGSVRGWQPGIAFDPTGDLSGNGIVSQGPGLPWKSVPTAFTNSDGLAAAGQCPVTWVSDSTYHVGVPCSYYIGGVAYTSLGGDVKTKSDPTYDRQFAIVVNTSSLPDTVGGSAQPDPEVPTVEADQLFLTSVYVNAGDATATQVGQTIIRDEGSGGEWTISKTLTSTDNYATNPYHLTISQRITGANSGQYMQWIAPAIQSKAAFTTLLLYVRNNSTFANVRNLTATLRNGNATQVGNAINLTTYGYSKTLLSAYQTIAIPMSAFAGADAFDRIRITNTQVGGTVDVQIDYVQLQSGITTGPPAAIKQVFFATVADMKAYSGTTDIVAVTLDYRTAGKGGGAIYKYDATSTAADNGGTVHKPNSIAAASPGRWIMNIENKTRNPLQFGAYFDGIHDDLAAWQACVAAVPQTLIAFNQYSRGIIKVPITDSASYWSDSLLIQDQISIIGESEAEFPFATIKINVASDKSGLVLKMGNPSGGSRGSNVENLAFFGLGTSEDTTKSGFYANGLVHADNVHAENFGRSGISINTTVSGNANISHCDNCSGQQNGLYGIEINGGESSQISIINPDFQFNGRSNIYDNGFLGVQIYGGHTSGAGMRSGHTSDVVVSHGGNYYFCKVYNVNIEPGVTSGWENYWWLEGPAIEIPGSAAAWNSSTVYHPAANLEVAGDAQGGTAFGLYCEGGSGPNILKGSNMAFGGQGFSTFNKIGLHLANDNNYFSAKGGSGFLAQKKTDTDIFARLNTTYGSVEVGSIINSGAVQFEYKDSIGGFYSANTEVFKMGFLAMAGGAPRWGLTSNQLAGTPWIGKQGLGFIDVNESANYTSIGANSIGMISMGDTYPISSGLQYQKGFVVFNKQMTNNDTLAWVANQITSGGTSAHWDRVYKPSAGTITAGYGLAGTTTFRVDTALITSKLWLYHVADSLGSLIGGAGGISGTMVSGRIPVGSGSSSLTTYSNFLYDGVNTMTIGGGQIRDNGSNMRFIASGNYEFFNGTNHSILVYNGAGDNGLTIYGLGRSINSMSGTDDIRFQTSGGNVVIGGTNTAASASKALIIQNGTAPTGSVTDGIALYSEDVSSSAELKVRDEAGNISTISPHNFTGIPEGKSNPMAWAFYSERDGKYINVDMYKLAELVEKLTGQKLIYTGDIKQKPNASNK